MRPVTTRTTGVVLLALLLAGFLLLGALPNQAAAIRVAGLSLLWWYGGVLAPVIEEADVIVGVFNRLELALYALDNQMEFGVWGGKTERQRRALRKQHPQVDSWSGFFAAQGKHRNVGEPA